MRFTWRRRAIPAIVTVLLAVGVPALATADGGGGGDDQKTLTSKPEDPDYAAGVRAIKAGEFAAAIALLERAIGREASNADAYNWLAYATRRHGDPSGSIPIYQKALTIDPKHRGAHEYIGEAYLMVGNLARAKEHLARLNSLCFFSCPEYRDLKKAIEGFEKTGKMSLTH